jgi:hypothetical protein
MRGRYLFIIGVKTKQTMLNRYQTHNKLLNLWSSLFPGTICDNVEKTEHWHELRDKSGRKMIRMTNAHLSAWNNGLIILHVPLSTLPFNPL